MCGQHLSIQYNLHEDKSQHAKDERTQGEAICMFDCIAEQNHSIPKIYMLSNKKPLIDEEKI